MFKVETHDKEKKLLIAHESELQDSLQSLQEELGMKLFFYSNFTSTSMVKTSFQWTFYKNINY